MDGDGVEELKRPKMLQTNYNSQKPFTLQHTHKKEAREEKKTTLTTMFNRFCRIETQQNQANEQKSQQPK